MASQPHHGTVYCARCYWILVGTAKHDCGALFCWSCNLQSFQCPKCKHPVVEIDRDEELDTMIADSISQYDIPAEDKKRYQLTKTIHTYGQLVASKSLTRNDLLKEIIEIERHQRRGAVSSMQPPYQQLTGGLRRRKKLATSLSKKYGYSQNSIRQLEEEMKRLQEFGLGIEAEITSHQQRISALMGKPFDEPPSTSITTDVYQRLMIHSNEGMIEIRDPLCVGF